MVVLFGNEPNGAITNELTPGSSCDDLRSMVSKEFGTIASSIGGCEVN